MRGNDKLDEQCGSIAVTANDMIESFKDSQMLHAWAVHLPIALAVLGVLLAFGTLFLSGKYPGLRKLTIGVYLLMVVTSWVAAASGLAARDEFKRLMAADAIEIADHHQAMASKVWALAFAVMVLLIAGSFSMKRVRRITAWLAAATALVTLFWVGLAAHSGTVLVYDWGVGTTRGTGFVQVERGGAGEEKDRDGGE